MFQERYQYQHSYREENGSKDPQIHFSGKLGDDPHHTGAGGAAYVSGQSEHGIHKGAAASQIGGAQREGTWPHQSHGKAADGAARQGQKRYGRKGSDQVAQDTQKAGGFQGRNQVQTFSFHAVEEAAEAHKEGKGAGSQKVTYSFGNFQAVFRKHRGPLADALFGSSCADHHKKQDPEYLYPENAFWKFGLFVISGDSVNRNLCKSKESKQRHQSPQRREEAPVFDSCQSKI